MINKCSLYKDSEESIDYILIHCDKTRELWCFFFFLSVVFGLVCVSILSEKSPPTMES